MERPIYKADSQSSTRSRSALVTNAYHPKLTDDGKLVFGRRDRTVSDFWKGKVPVSSQSDSAICTIADLKRCLAENPEYLEISRYNGSGKSLIADGVSPSDPEGNEPLILGSIPIE